jgi:nicotinamide-nucleotide amidase
VSTTLIACWLQAHGQWLAVAETSAGGLVTATLLRRAGASTWFRGAVVPYARGARSLLLGLPEGGELVSEEAALELARAVRARLASDWALAESGIAGPQRGRQSTKPVGLVCLAVVGPGTERTRTLLLPAQRRQVLMRAFARAALQFLAETLAEQSLAR